MARWAHGEPASRRVRDSGTLSGTSVREEWRQRVLTARKPDATTIQTTVDMLVQRRLATLANAN